MMAAILATRANAYRGRSVLWPRREARRADKLIDVRIEWAQRIMRRIDDVFPAPVSLSLSRAKSCYEPMAPTSRVVEQSLSSYNRRI